MLSLQCDVNTAESLQGLRTRNEYCDVIIVSSDGQQTFAHSCVLASHSSVIATVLQNRLAAQHDWSILRPLVINIDEVSMKDTPQQDVVGDIHIMEILISLMYGEVVSVSDLHVPALNECAHVLGLSDQIFTSLDSNEGKHPQYTQYDTNIKCKKAVRKSVLAGEPHKNEHEMHAMSMGHQMFPGGIPKPPQEKPVSEDSVIDSLNGRDHPENLLSFSMLCSESQDDDSNGSRNWHEGDVGYDKDAGGQNQGCNVIVCKTEESAGAQKQKRQPKKNMICTVCRAAFQKCGDLVKHVQTMQHFTEQCPLCFIRIEEAEDQRLHFSLHDQELPFFCVYCDMRFRTRAALTMHTPKHMTSKPASEGENENNTADGEEQLTFKIVDQGTQRAKRMLIDSKGYTYTVKRQRGDNTYWCCTIRTKTQRCKATVSQIGDVFKDTRAKHCHDLKSGGLTSRILATRVKEEAVKDVNAAAASIVDKVVSECINLEKPNYDTLFHNNLIRKANRIRQKLKQEKSTDLEFQLNVDFMPSSFLLKDLIVGNERHLIFATTAQMRLLHSSKLWYLDGNCTIPCQPFVKIFAIHTFVESGEDVIQSPIAFVLMSRCQEKDYKEIFKCIMRQLPEAPQVDTIVAGFEKPLWRAVTGILKNSKLQGCAFHWGKTVWKKAQKLGLKAEAVRQDETQEKFIGKVLTLPFLPPEHIEPAYSQLCDSAKGYTKFESLMEYIGNTWISSSLWAASSWNVFMQPVRTCNDVEGWHHRVNHQLNQVNPIFYNVIWLLLQESEGISLDAKAVNEDRLKKHQRRETGIRSKLFILWDTYLTGTMSSSFFLKKCGSLYSPEITTS